MYQHPTTRRPGFTLFDLLIVILVVALLIAIVIPAVRAVRRNSMRMQNGTQVQGIGQALSLISRTNSRQYPAPGKVDDATVEGRFQILLDGNFLTPEYLVNPLDEDKHPSSDGIITSDNYSYSLLKIDSKGKRRDVWFGNIRQYLPLVSDRNTGTGAGPLARSIHSTKDWRGSIAYTDGHTNFEVGNIRDGDDLFAVTGPDDIMMIHTGE